MILRYISIQINTETTAYSK